MLSPMMVLAGFTIVVGIYPDIFLTKNYAVHAGSFGRIVNGNRGYCN